MSIEQKLSELGIETILIVDDRQENINAAKQYFQTLPAETSYASSAKEAIEKMKETKYDLVITDLQMETQKSGQDVVKEALIESSYATIATGANYDKPESDPHGPSTTIRPSGASIRSKKDKPETWAFALDKSLDYIADYKRGPEAKALQRYNKFVGKISAMPEEMIDLLIEKYK